MPDHEEQMSPEKHVQSCHAIPEEIGPNDSKWNVVYDSLNTPFSDHQSKRRYLKKKLKAMIVDDNVFNILALRTMLKSLNEFDI